MEPRGLEANFKAFGHWSSILGSRDVPAFHTFAEQTPVFLLDFEFRVSRPVILTR